MPNFPNTHIQIHTLKELNELSSADNCLMLLRVLNTSDLSWMYSLFQPSTLLDIKNVCLDLMKLDQEYVASTWTAEEITEWNGYIEALSNDIDDRT